MELNISDDAVLLSLIRQDDLDAFEKIYNKYWSKLYISAYNILRDRCASEDVVQEVLTALWLKRETAEIRSLNAYLYSAVRFQIFNLIRSGKVRESLFLEIEKLTVDNAAEGMLYEQDIYRIIDEEIAVLPERCREIFALSRKENLSTKEIASRLGLAPKTVENQLTIALRRLRVNMEHVLFWASLIFALYI